MSAFIHNPNFHTIGSKEEIINTNRSKINTKFDSIVDYYDKYEDMAEFTEEENIKNKCPNNFGKVHSKEQLEKSFQLDKKNNDDYCNII